MYERYQVTSAPTTSVFDYKVVAETDKDPVTLIKDIKKGFELKKTFLMFDLEIHKNASVEHYFVGSLNSQVFIYPISIKSQEAATTLGVV